MTAQPGERQAASSWAADSPFAKVGLGAAALLSGLAAGWLAMGSFGLLAALAVLLAAANGYAKAYSP